jgi:hypothetical protein
LFIFNCLEKKFLELKTRNQLVHVHLNYFIYLKNVY